MGVARSRLISLFSFVDQALFPKTTFKIDEVPDLTGRVVLVTGKPSHTRRVLSSFTSWMLTINTQQVVIPVSERSWSRYPSQLD